MPVLSKPAFGPKVALVYVTIGALIDVWTVVYYFAFARSETMSNTTWFFLLGLFFTGVVLIVLGLILGPLGRAARQAELPPTDASTQAETNIQRTAAANPPQVVSNPGAMMGAYTAPPSGTPAPPGPLPAGAVPVQPQRPV
jgi:hypothetical protein